MRTSYSALDTFIRCPQKFKFQVIDKIAAKPSVEAAFGSSVHSALKFMFSREPLYPTLEEILLHFTEKWQSSALKLNSLDDTLKNTYSESGKNLLKSFFKRNPPWNFSTVDTESRFEVPLSDPEKNEHHILAGIIDRVDKIGDGEYEIIDYKTNRRLPSQEQINSDLQMSIYHMALLKRWPNLKPQNIKLSLYFLKHDEKLSSQRTVEELNFTKEKVLKTIREINKRTVDNNFPPNPSALCEYCPYKPICPAWKHLYKKSDSPPPDEKKLQESLAEYLSIKDKDNQNQKRLKELQGIIGSYMDANNLDRVFDERGYYVARKLQQRFSYDFEQIKAILISGGLESKWQELLKADDKKLKTILKDLPSTIQNQILAQKSISKEFKVFTASTKPVKK
jgi:RecB family exonuclease